MPVIFSALFLLAAVGQDHAVPEGIHRNAKGPIALCGLNAPDVPSLRTQIEKGDWVPADGGPRFDVFDPARSSDSMTQWVFTKGSEPTHPSVTCRRLFKAADGSLQMAREMRCGGMREACDKLFLEFQTLDDRMRASMKKR